MDRVVELGIAWSPPAISWLLRAGALTPLPSPTTANISLFLDACQTKGLGRIMELDLGVLLTDSLCVWQPSLTWKKKEKTVFQKNSILLHRPWRHTSNNKSSTNGSQQFRAFLWNLLTSKSSPEYWCTCQDQSKVLFGEKKFDVEQWRGFNRASYLA